MCERKKRNKIEAIFKIVKLKYFLFPPLWSVEKTPNRWSCVIWSSRGWKEGWKHFHGVIPTEYLSFGNLRDERTFLSIIIFLHRMTASLFITTEVAFEARHSQASSAEDTPHNQLRAIFTKRFSIPQTTWRPHKMIRDLEVVWKSI